MNFVVWLNDPGGGHGISLRPALNALAKIYDDVNFLGIVVTNNEDAVKSKESNIIEKKNLKNLDIDLVLFCEIEEDFLISNRESNFVSALKEASRFGIDADKFVLDRTVLVPNFTLEKYNQLRHSKLSILSMNCFGGLVYHRFGLPFLTPTINMFTTDQDFLSFLKNPAENVESNFELVKTEFNPALNIEYPVFKIGVCTWNMNHYSDFEFAKQKWIERTQRINWKNLLVTMYTENPDILEEFDKLPFEKKVCFVPFETDLDSGYYIDLNKLNNPELWQAVNGIASGRVPFYDMWDMLLYGKKTSLIEQ